MGVFDTDFKEISPSERRPGQQIEFNPRARAAGLPTNRQLGVIVAQRHKARVEEARWQGGTLHDMTAGGDYTGVGRKEFIVKVSAEGTPDSIVYSVDGGKTWSDAAVITAGAMALTDGVEVTFGATTGHSVDDEWRIVAWPEPLAAEAVDVEIFSADESAQKFGYGSIAHDMADVAIRNNDYLAPHIVTLDDADTAQAAKGGYIFAGTATGPGSFECYIARHRVKVGFGTGDTDEDIAIAVQEEIAKHPEFLASGAIDTVNLKKLVLTAKNKGELGNSIHLGFRITEGVGISVTTVSMSGGSVDPEMAAALTAIYKAHYHWVASAYQDETLGAEFRDHLDNVSSPTEARRARGVISSAGMTLAEAVTLSDALNAKRLHNLFPRYTDATPWQGAPWQVAANYMAEAVAIEDPAMPHNTMKLKSIPPPAPEDWLSEAEIQTLLWSGVTPLVVGPDGVVQVLRSITTYTKNELGVPDDIWLDTTRVGVMDYMARAISEGIALKYTPAKLSSKTPERVKLDIKDILISAEEAEILDNVKETLPKLEVSKSSTSPGRLNARIPVTPVDGFHVFAGMLDMLV